MKKLRGAGLFIGKLFEALVSKYYHCQRRQRVFRRRGARRARLEITVLDHHDRARTRHSHRPPGLADVGTASYVPANNR